MTKVLQRDKANDRIGGDIPVIAIAGNPNAGKTTLFNALTGLRAKTSNFPGTTIECRTSRTKFGDVEVELLDLPGLYSLNDCSDEEKMTGDALQGRIEGREKPVGIILVADATNLERNLYLAGQILEMNLPVVVALTMMDLAAREKTSIDTQALSRELGCPIVPIDGRAGSGFEGLREECVRMVKGEIASTSMPERLQHACNCNSCPFKAHFDWTREVCDKHVQSKDLSQTDKSFEIDRLLTHPVGGILAFATVMLSFFFMVFYIAQYPMGWIDGLFAHAGSFVNQYLPQGDLNSLLVDGVIGGVGGMLIFLPQICILFFSLTLLEDTGYLARAAFVMDRLMRRVGLPGKAFVPMLSAHACAIPGIMATRGIEDKRDRLVTILVLPLLTCSARIPVYAMVCALLFPTQPMMAALTFTGAYALGGIVALIMAFVLRRSILPGETKPLVLELPSYKMPSIRNAFLMALDRAGIFVRRAGTVIMVISILLWTASTYPKIAPPQEISEMLEKAKITNDEELAQKASRLESKHAFANSFAGRLGKAIEPVIEPLGFDWQIGVGVISSFAAREVIVSTLSIVYGIGEDGGSEDPDSLYDALRASRRSDGSPVFTTATCISLLVFYILAMQCLPTQVVTRRETGSWKWAALQFGYMTVLAYFAAFATYQGLLLFT
jgi:ferrous iron transport protein B